MKLSGVDFRWDSPAQEAYDLAVDKWSGADEVWQAMEWTLLHDPHAGAPLNEEGSLRSHTIDGARSRGWPTVTVLYRIENPYITFLEADFTEASYGQSGNA